MKTKFLRRAALALGLGVCTVAQAQSPYTSTARWNNFYPASAKGQVDENAAAANTDLPDPVAQPLSDAPSAGVPAAASSTYHSPYAQAAAAPWSGSQDGCSTGACAPSRPELSPWFGSSNLLFLNLEQGSGRPIATGLGDFNTSLVDPDASTGFDITAGRYLDCGRYGLGITYFLWDADRESLTRTGVAGTIRANNPAYRDISIDPGPGPDNVYDYIDGVSGFSAGATGVRVTRDLRFQGIEANLYSFGLMGAQRAAYAGCGNGSIFGSGLGIGSGSCGHGGAAGPLVRSNSGRVRVMTSHGFRWLQIEDSAELAYNIDGNVGYQADDIYNNVDIENNLYGYQFGGRLTYCLTSRLNMNIGGKFGIYGNDVEMRHRLGTQTDLAYINGAPTQTIDTESSDTVLATLGELDMGLGFRVSNAWTVRGGYRLMGVTGVADAMQSFPREYSSLATAGQVHANDSYVLHGGYVGLEYNW